MCLWLVGCLSVVFNLYDFNVIYFLFHLKYSTGGQFLATLVKLTPLIKVLLMRGFRAHYSCYLFKKKKTSEDILVFLILDNRWKLD